MRHLRPLLIVAAALALVAAGCGGGSTKVPSDAVAIVNGQPVTKSQLDQLITQAKVTYKNQKRPFPKAGSAEYQALQTQAITFLVQRSEFAQEADKMGIKVTDKQVEDRLKFIVSPKLALLAFSLIIAGGFAMLPILRRARALGVFTASANLSLIDTASQFLLGLKLAVSQDLQSRFVSEFRYTQDSLNARQILYFRQQAANRAAVATITAIVGAIVVFVGYGVLHLEPALLVTFLLVVGRMAGPAGQVQQGLQFMAFGLPAFEATMALVRELKSAPSPNRGDVRVVPTGAIVFDSVGYRHANASGSESGGLRDVSVSIAPGSFVGISGASGTGKTTLADLMVGLLRPQQGRILIGDVPLDDSLLPGWRTQLAYISQDPFLFHDTLRKNLQWVDPDASDARMWEALECAGADKIVQQMPQGLDTIAGERGSLISGGERQRLAVARALLRRPSLLIMDEATNAIDVDGERALLGRLLAMRPRLTIVMIAHRQESLALCDRILYLENGALR